MTNLPTSLLRAVGDLAEPAVLKVVGKSVALTLALFAVLGWAGSRGLDAALAAWGLDDDRGLSALLAVLLTLLAAWLLFRIVALAVLQFFADEVVVAIERRDYPPAAEAARKLGLGEEIRQGLRGAGRALAANLVAAPFAVLLLFTAVGPAVLLWAVNAWLLGIELVEMVWVRHGQRRFAQPPVGAVERFLLGGAIAALLAVPLVNLLAPVLGAAAATHLVHRKRKPRHAA